MKKYTAIYTEHWMSGSHMQTLVQMKRFDLSRNEKIEDALEKEGIADAVVFLFEGWPELATSFDWEK